MDPGVDYHGVAFSPWGPTPRCPCFAGSEARSDISSVLRPPYTSQGGATFRRLYRLAEPASSTSTTRAAPPPPLFPPLEPLASSSMVLQILTSSTGCPTVCASEDIATGVETPPPVYLGSRDGLNFDCHGRCPRRTAPSRRRGDGVFSTMEDPDVTARLGVTPASRTVAPRPSSPPPPVPRSPGPPDGIIMAYGIWHILSVTDAVQPMLLLRRVGTPAFLMG